jgi:peptidoglycan/LPS O-acetylase OafA/YrhL
MAVTYGSKLGHGAVMLFFVISGYLVGGSLLQRLPNFDTRFYAISRFSRIYIALIPALLLTVGLDGLAYVMAPDNPVYTTNWSGPINHNLFESYTPRNIAATLLSLESVIGMPMGSNGPLWSLGFEWLFYIMLPCIVLALRRYDIVSKFYFLFPVSGIALTLIAFGKRYVAVFWIIWMAGAYAKLIARKGIVKNWMSVTGGWVALAAYVVSPVVNQRITDPIIGIGFALFLCNTDLLYASLNRSGDRMLAGFSFSLYIVHLPIMAFLMMLFVQAGLTSTAGLEVGAKGVLIWMTLMVFSILIAWFFGHTFERRTDDFRRFLLSKLGGPQQIPSASATAS